MNTIKFKNLTDLTPRFSKNNFLVYLAIFTEENKPFVCICAKLASLLTLAMHDHYVNKSVTKAMLKERIRLVELEIQRSSDVENRKILHFELSILKGAIA